MARILTFSLSVLATGRGAALALICPEARYASIAWRRSDRLERRFVHAVAWQAIERDLRVGLPAGALPDDSAIVHALLDKGWRGTYALQYAADLILEIVPATAAHDLDAELRRQAEALAG